MRIIYSEQLNQRLYGYIQQKGNTYCEVEKAGESMQLFSLAMKCTLHIRTVNALSPLVGSIIQQDLNRFAEYAAKKQAAMLSGRT
ncbi:hypothetical protein CBR_g29410 [Chara braunii]|uniref:Uncharacterized protein n=1 Tax=Chara braunii TaxID=69332 RepID=A0A388JWV4_CHABU|nr:hypothetical protein CBR_g29410 [Chara braunii]|eukprot:GBG62212.1 hypothetical protein CBR_g29410 [Chara braunii]